MKKGLTWFNLSSITLGFAFLYLPIIILIVYSFSASRLASVWGGFSTRWYEKLLNNEPLKKAALVTLETGLFSATIATVLGTMAAVTLVRMGRFPTRGLFSGLVFAPLVMPEIIMALALLLMFIAMGLDRGMTTLILAHVTFTMSYVAVTVQARLVTFDRSLEEAAQDLGCPPWKSFFLITLPVIWPAVLSGWMLAFTLSIDDFVISYFVAGPNSTTLPMKIYSQVKFGITPELNALCTVLIGIVAIGVITATLVQKHRLVEMERAAKAAKAAG
jgi:putrescine transport system permease protein